MIHGVIQNGAIVPLDPIPPEWDDGREVWIEVTGGATLDERAEIERWYAQMESLGAAQYAPGERAAIEAMWAEADAEAKVRPAQLGSI